MNNPNVVISQPLSIITRKSLAKAADEYMANAVGVYSQQDVFEAVVEIALSANSKTLVNELAWSITKETIKRRTTPRLSHSDDWVGYGEMGISLPESKLVNVYYAEDLALNIRRENVRKNKETIVRAADEEISRIDRLIKMMKKVGVPTAGPALEILQRGGIA